MTDDLISREALKNYARKVMYEKNATNFSLLKIFDEIIDNAPTVSERPKGNWVRTGQSFINPNKFRNFCCSNCLCELDVHIRIEPNFCPNCGAEMSKGGAE